MEGDEAIIHDPPESHRLSKTQHTFLTVRNIFVVIAGGLFILSMLHIEPIYHYWNILKFVAYILGAGAYGAEVIVLTDGWRKNPGLKEMLMRRKALYLRPFLKFSSLGRRNAIPSYLFSRNWFIVSTSASQSMPCTAQACSRLSP